MCDKNRTLSPCQEKHILVMDDEEQIRNIAEQFLLNLGCKVELAQDGNEAIAKYKESILEGRNFDAVILDLEIKEGLGGKETIQQLISIDPSIKAIISSGCINNPVVIHFKDYGFCASMPKPYILADLRNTLNKVL